MENAMPSPIEKGGPRSGGSGLSRYEKEMEKEGNSAFL